MKILAIDPGCTQSGYVIVRAAEGRIEDILRHGKEENATLVKRLFWTHWGAYDALCIEMVASYGMPVGAEVFDTCFWAGRFWEALGTGRDLLVYRKEEKMHLCGSMKANDASIRQALADKYGRGYPNHGKGTKKNPSMLYGLKADEWAALAVADVAAHKLTGGAGNGKTDLH